MDKDKGIPLQGDDKRRIKQAKRDELQRLEGAAGEAKHRQKERKRKERQCFWTWPWGHVFKYEASLSDMAKYVCVGCDKENFR